ncbi:DMT family transporter [Sinorhizobium fredii]|uniref:DMT family transporter n=1 Tax=Rhizobium fredii TaxID=380 RepID=UPI0035120C67
MSDAVATVSYRPRSGISAVVMLIILEGALVISWSAGFVGIRFAIDHAPIFLILLWRSLVSGLLLLPFALIMGPAIRWKDAFAQIVFGALAMSGYLAGFALAISYGVPTGLVALIADMLPLAVAILSWPVLGQVLTGRQWFGSGLGMAGVLIASGWSLNMGSVPLWAYGLPVLGTLSLAMATLLQKRSPSKSMPVYQSLCIQCLSAAAIFAVFAWYEGGVLPVLDQGFIGGILWLVFVATFGAWSLYYIALRKSSPARVTAILYLSPPVTMIWAWLMFGEPLSFARWPWASWFRLSASSSSRDRKSRRIPDHPRLRHDSLDRNRSKDRIVQPFKVLQRP